MGKIDRSRWKGFFSSIQYIWRLAMPLWIFRDAGYGSAEQRIANYRYNRSQRKVLPFYLWKWVGIAACLMQLTQLLSNLMAATAAQSTNHLCATLACMSAGIGLAFSCVVIVILLTSYLYLTYVKK